MRFFVLSLLVAITVPAYSNTPVLRHGQVRLGTGVRVHYVEQGDPKGSPIILLHGYSDSWVSYTKGSPIILLHGYSDSWVSYTKG